MISPLITMSAITGKPTKDEIFVYLKSLKDNGIDQTMIYPRSGCEIEYLSEEWFKTIGWFLEAAKTLKMVLWLYDDFNWPSGDAGGKVTQIKDFRLKSIAITGDNIGKISYHSTHNSSLFGEKFFPDLLSDKAVDYFIECTHEKYYEKFKDYFGTVIKGIFTDEPAIGYCSTSVSIPYYDGIENDYKIYCGRNFFDDLKDSHNDFLKSGMAVIAKRFNKCFISKLNNWCKKHNIIMTGHLMSDDLPSGATKQNGNFLKNLSSFMLPGIDELSTNFKKEALMSLLGGAEYASGKMGAMAELFALGPCDMTYAKKRCMIFLASCFKINHYFLAISHMDMRGNLKICDFFSDFSSDQPDFQGMKLLASEAKIAEKIAENDYIPDVYIRYPTSICANKITQDVSMHQFTTLINKLSYQQIQWKFADEDDLCDNIPIIEFSDNFEYIYDGIITSDVTTIINMINKDIIVTDTEGDMPEGVFVRKLKNKKVVVLNLFGKSGIYKINGTNFKLDEYGVFIYDKELKKTSHLKREKLQTVFDIKYHNNNIIRAMFINSQTVSKICCDKEFDITFAIRKGVTASLSDNKIECRNQKDILSDGLKKLYDISDVITLNKTTNILESEKDFKYLPSVFISGDFCAESISDEICSVHLKERKKFFEAGDLFSDFGKVEFFTNIKIPKDAKSLELKGTKLYTSIYIDDILIGEKIHSPYIYDLGEKFKNKNVILKIVQYSSIGPIFADVDYFDKASEKSQWRGTMSTGKTLFGFNEINWIF